MAKKYVFKLLLTLTRK